MTSVAEAVLPRRSRRALTTLLLVAGAIGIGFIIARAPPYFLPDHSEAKLHAAHLPWLLIHIGAGAVALLAGPVQLWLGLSDRVFGAHRPLGMLYIGSVAVGTVAAFGTLALHPNLRPAFAFGLAGLAVAWVTTTGMAFVAIRRSLIEQHKEWMIRSYVVTFGFVAFRVIGPTLQAAGVPSDRGVIAAWACWALPLLIAELVLQGRKVFAVAR